MADRQLDEFVGNGRCEFLGEYAKPFATLAIAQYCYAPTLLLRGLTEPHIEFTPAD